MLKVTWLMSNKAKTRTSDSKVLEPLRLVATHDPRTLTYSVCLATSAVRQGHSDRGRGMASHYRWELS